MQPTWKQRIVQSHRGLAIAAVVANVVIAGTGSTVRVTGSGLGCTEWPHCLPGSFVPVEHPELAMLNQWIEYGNRLLAVVVGVIGVLCLLAAWWSRPLRTRVLLLSAVMTGGVFAQAVIGGITVNLGLLWWTVAFHFIVSPVLAWYAVLLWRSLDEEDGPARPIAGALAQRLLVAAVVVLAALMVVGTMVTGAGPHAGDADVARFDAPVETLAQAHSVLLYAFLAVLAALGWSLRGAGVRKPYAVLLVAVLLQGAVGFAQYFTGVPAVLVVVHVLGSMAVVVAMANLWTACRVREPATDQVVLAA
ncbi:COX15/CtaA family protein [Actinosynnema mirum]|uniref:Cytochrome oxidase assembly n=1 Tax=Actinosynnema mirum (strain ATCC 29888 / DSM 43827 / JCM 3225 / NBRC 14064 / NCIMB 13271 / NRRL B-12336 / IMRU 3971 / 101) TaxID=446462 RepID=C6WMG1_ACTMD|nr:COX15/CtaA family protein [Actinosynnema mirum]ACU36490.1 cytochrome oxidase assembly [Actinosynnema mirum DSM 43827]